MNLYLVYVKESVKDIAFFRIPTGKKPMSNQELDDTRKLLIGDRIALWVTADDPNEIESKIIESGFKSKFDFIANYSKPN